MFPVQITLRDTLASPSLETHIRKRAEKLNQYYDRVMGCRIVVELQQKHKHQGKLFNVRIDVTVPGKELVVTKKMDQDIYVAIREAFSAIIRRLEEHSKKRHGRIKTHNDIQKGTISRIIANEDYGFIEGADGNEYYFSITNVSYPRFDQLMVGDHVQYICVPLNDGWQAHRVIRERHREAA
jgi:ribosomal subunit interface protein